MISKINNVSNIKSGHDSHLAPDYHCSSVVKDLKQKQWSLVQISLRDTGARTEMSLRRVISVKGLSFGVELLFEDLHMFHPKVRFPHPGSEEYIVWHLS